MRDLAAGVFSSILLFFFATPAVAGDRPIVAVFDVEVRGPVMSKEVLDRLTDYLGTLVAQHSYKVVPRSQIKERLREQKKDSYKQCYDQSCQIDLGRELAADKSLAAQVLKLGSECKVTLTLYDLKQSASEGAGAASGGCTEDGIVKSLEKAVTAMMGEGTSSTGAKPPDMGAHQKPAAVAAPTSRCEITLPKEGCPRHPVTDLVINDNFQSADLDQARCMQRAKEYFYYCGNLQAVTARFFSGGVLVQAERA